MPEFQPKFTPEGVDGFTAAFCDAVEWTLPEEGGGDGPFVEPTDFAPETVAFAKRICAAFQADHAALLAKAYEGTDRRAYDEASAGHDLWLDATGSGVGFWDRGFAGDLGDKLSKAAKATLSYPDAYVGDDTLIYISGAESEPTA